MNGAFGNQVPGEGRTQQPCLHRVIAEGSHEVSHPLVTQ
jgi:hypothetical protein